jgi:hypothetical protein
LFRSGYDLAIGVREKGHEAGFDGEGVIIY